MYNNFYIHKKKLLKIGAYCMILVLVRQFCFSVFLSNINLKKKKRNMGKRQSYGEMETEK